MIRDSYNPTKIKPSIQSIKIITLQHAPGNPEKVCRSVCKSQNVYPLSILSIEPTVYCAY